MVQDHVYTFVMVVWMFGKTYPLRCAVGSLGFPVLTEYR